MDLRHVRENALQNGTKGERLAKLETQKLWRKKFSHMPVMGRLNDAGNIVTSKSLYVDLDFRLYIV